MLGAASAAIAIAGCGGGGSSSDPASMVPASAPIYVEATLTPQGTLKANVESLTASLAGVDNLGEKIVTELEQAATSNGAPVNFAKDIQPWLGERAGVYLENFDGENFNTAGSALETTDAAAAQEFVDKRAAKGEGHVKHSTYEGIDYVVEPEDGSALGVVGNFLVFGQTDHAFKAMVDASKGESLADEDSFSSAVSQLPSGSLAQVFVDIGGLIDEAGGAIDAESKLFLDSVGIEPADATAVASLIPGSEQVEIDFSTDLTGTEDYSGDASSLLGSMPAGSVLALSADQFGKHLGKAIDRLDASGNPSQELRPHEFKSALKQAGIDLDKITAAVGDAALFIEGSSESNLDGALLLSTKNATEATNTVANVGLLLRASGTPGVTAINGKLSGFSVAKVLGRQPLIVAAKGERIAVAYGLPAAIEALSTESGHTLSDSPTYKEAVAALGGTPISAFADGPATLKLVSALQGADEREGFLKAKPYLDKIGYVAIGAGKSGDLATAKLIVGVGK
jgi:hypothetical protein